MGAGHKARTDARTATRACASAGAGGSAETEDPDAPADPAETESEAAAEETEEAESEGWDMAGQRGMQPAHPVCGDRCTPGRTVCRTRISPIAAA